MSRDEGTQIGMMNEGDTVAGADGTFSVGEGGEDAVRTHSI